nr:hypothetical protein [Fimbriiglobus sp.]
LERAGRLPVPAESSRDAARAALDLARVYSAAGRPLAAAVYAEHLARTARSPSAAAKAAAVALDAYSRASRSTPSDDLRAVDRERRISLATHIDRIAPNEPDADGVRVQLAADLYRAGRKLEAFEAFARVPARFPRLAQARMFEGIAAFDLIRPLSADETRTEGLTAERKQTIYQKAVADLAAVPIPVDAVKDDPEGDAPVSDYFNLRLQLAQLHLTQGAKGYTPAEEVVVSSAEVAQKHPGLAADEKARFAMRFELMHIRAVYAQAMPLYQQGKFAEAAERFGKLLDPVLAAGPAAKKHSAPELIDLAKSLDADRVRLLLVPALNARVREGAAAKTSELLDKLKEFGGDLSTSARVVQQGVGSIRPAVDALRKEKKDADADKLIDAVTGMVAKLAGEKDLPNDVRVNLGKSFRELGQYARAAELLTIVPPPSNMEAFKSEQKASENETAEQAAAREKDAAAVPLYRAARVELARAYRLDKKFTEAAAVLDEALGKEAEQKNATGVKPRAGGWASRFPEYRKESILLLEAKATADPKGGALLWNEAIANWRGWSAEYVQALNTLNRTYYPAKRDSERLTTRARLLDALANKEKVDFDDEKKQAAKELEQAVKDAAAADEGVAAATKAVDAANNPADAEKAREALDTARDMADDAARKVGELKARLPLLEEFAKLKDPDWADEAKKAQQAVEPLQRQMGEMERKINPLRSILQDVSAEQMRCVAAAQAAITRQSNPTNYAAYLTRQGKEIAEFEKKNRPLPVNVKQKLYDLLESNKELKDEYRKAGGIDFLTPPSGQ